MSDGPVLGIDLGTTNSVVAIADGGQARVISDPEGRRMVPSVVSFHPAGHKLVGYEARDRRLIDAKNTVYAVKRLIGRPYDSPEVERARQRFGFAIAPNKHGGCIVEVRSGRYALAEISAIVLRELRRISELDLGVACERAVITVPANFNELQRSATKAAGKVAGLDVLRILNEPTAAALAYGYGKKQKERVAVYDLGGGTFDITVLELDNDVFEVLATGGNSFLGGEDIDRAVGEVMAQQFLEQHGWDPRSDSQAFERLKAAGEWAKCQLSEEQAVRLTIEELTIGEGGRPLDLEFEMTRAELEEISHPWLQQSFDVCDAALKDASFRADEVDSVVLVGGSTRMPLCRRMVESYFGMTPNAAIDPDMVVAQGAAIHGYALGGAAQDAAAKARGKSTLGRVALQRLTAAEIEQRQRAKRIDTIDGMPRQPAFAPPERPAQAAPRARPAKISDPPPSLPNLPDGPTVVREVRAVTTPKTTMDMELDGLAPDRDARQAGSLDDLAPPAFADPADPFADLAPDDPFTAPTSGGSKVGFLDELDETDAALDDPFELPAPRERGRKKVPAREPTTPFSIDRRDALDPPKPPVVERRPPPPRPPPTPRVGTPHVAPPLPAPPAPVASPPALPPAQKAAWLPSQPPPLAQPVLPMVDAAPPILMDVTPHSLGIETAGGYCRHLILKNAPVPTEQTRGFTTARDDQTEVAVRICQGESDSFDANQILGEVVLSELPRKARGSVSIDVAFMLDADGTLDVDAVEPTTGTKRSVKINLRGGLNDADIAAMRLRIEAEEL
ncbi:MAG: Hsp70 family protein [Sandaracinaceae bacterium]